MGSNPNPKATAINNRQEIRFEEHRLSPEECFQKHDVNPENGLTTAQVEERRAKYGLNCLTPPKQIPAWIQFALQFTNFFSLLLIAAGILCFVAVAIDPSDETFLYLGIVLFLVVFATSIFSYIQDAKSAAIMEGFSKMIPKFTSVYRNGTLSKVHPEELVPGDIVDLNEGDQIPADMRLIKANDIKVDNSSLTGESEAIERGVDLLRDGVTGQPIDQELEANNLVFFSTTVESGTARGIVIGTGDNTMMGDIASMALGQDAEETPLSKEIKTFIRLISVIAITLGVAFFSLGFLLGTNPIRNVVNAIGIIVANVPEGLLATVTVSLALTAQRMFARNVLVKNLEAVETLGSTTVIASDKTGTLTQNRMTVQHCWYDLKVFSTPAAWNRIDLKKKLSEDTQAYNKEEKSFKILQMIATLCNNAKFIFEDAQDGDSANREFQKKLEGDEAFNILSLPTAGDATESGIIKFCEAIQSISDYNRSHPKIFEIKFNSTNKWQLSIHKQPDKNHPVLVMKGAPERVWMKCTSILVNGELRPIDDAIQEQYDQAYKQLGGMGERVLGFAYREMVEFGQDFEFSNRPNPNFPVDDLVFVGFISLIDPPRPGVPEAVEKCKRAQIKVMMVTGDHPITAEAIAKQVNIIDEGAVENGTAIVIKGDDIRSWLEIDDPVEQQRKWDTALSHKQIVFARVSPAHKLQIVANNQRRGEVVAVTGDGVNDAPALKKADIGIAMGIAGKDVSKLAADMILMDDNFASIVNGVEEGRLIFDNLKKSIAYTLTSNIPEIAPFILFMVLGLPLALTTVLILCVDLGTDMVPAISLAYEEKESDIMDRPPRNSATDRLVNRKLISFAYFQIGVMQALAGFFTYMIVLSDFGYPPYILIGTALEWNDNQLLCTVKDNGQPGRCGFGCGSPDLDQSFYLPAVQNLDGDLCEDGCRAPCFGSACVVENAKSNETSITVNGAIYKGVDRTQIFASVDPFSEFFTPGERRDDGMPLMGFRGDSDACEISCANWCDIVFPTYKNRPDVQAAFGMLSTEADCIAQLLPVIGCTDGKDTQSVGYVDRSSSSPLAKKGAVYWWAGRAQQVANPTYQSEALAYAQTAYFVSIIIVQWADLLIAKTRKLSIFSQGMTNGFMNFGLLFETILGAILVYTPFLNAVFGTRPLHILHWFPGVPFSILIFVYDEVRKSLMRQSPGGWLDVFTYW